MNQELYMHPCRVVGPVFMAFFLKNNLPDFILPALLSRCFILVIDRIINRGFMIFFYLVANHSVYL